MKGNTMNYYEWSNEYYKSALEVNDSIEKLKNQRKIASKSIVKELDSRITEYKKIYNDCMSIANHLMNRYYGLD